MEKTPREILDIKTADLKKSAPDFHKQSEALRKAAHTLMTNLAELGHPWGDDEQGAKFGDAYTPQIERIEKSTAILVTGLASIHTAMTDMADGHIDNEALIAAMFRKVEAVDGQGEQGDR